MNQPVYNLRPRRPREESEEDKSFQISDPELRFFQGRYESRLNFELVKQLNPRLKTATRRGSILIEKPFATYLKENFTIGGRFSSATDFAIQFNLILENFVTPYNVCRINTDTFQMKVFQKKAKHTDQNMLVS